MKILEVVRRAQEDEKYALKLRNLAYKARDEGMESAAYRALTKDFVETPSDKMVFKTTMAYTMMLSVTASKFICLNSFPTIRLGIGPLSVLATPASDEPEAKSITRAPRKASTPGPKRPARSKPS